MCGGVSDKGQLAAGLLTYCKKWIKDAVSDTFCRGIVCGFL